MADTRALVDRLRTDIYPHIAPCLAEAVSLLSGDHELRVVDQNNARRYNLGRVHMSAIMYVCRIEGTAVGKLLSREKSADEYFSECHRVEGSEHDNDVGSLARCYD